MISIEVVEFLEHLPRKACRVVRNAIRSIGDDPLGCSDAVEHDEIGRRMQIAIVGDYALIYWVDDADRHVKILDIHPADQ